LEEHEDGDVGAVDIFQGVYELISVFIESTVDDEAQKRHCLPVMISVSPQEARDPAYEQEDTHFELPEKRESSRFLLFLVFSSLSAESGNFVFDPNSRPSGIGPGFRGGRGEAGGASLPFLLNEGGATDL